jgi:uncharacterized RDD family membrane protein YckC
MRSDEPIVTGEAVALELRLAGAGSRGLAALLDLTFTTVLQALLLLVIVVIGAGSNSDAVLTVLIITIVGVTLGYPVAFESLWRGRTPGKAMVGLRVVRDDGGPIRFRHAFVRGLVGVVLDKPGLSSGLLAFIPIMAGSRNKRLGDLAAGTIVLQDRVPATIEPPVPMPPQLAGWAATLDLSAVDDALALRIRQYLGRAASLTAPARGALEAQLTGEVVARVGAPPHQAPGWAVLTAVLAERRTRAASAYPPAASPWQPAPAYSKPPSSRAERGEPSPAAGAPGPVSEEQRGDAEPAVPPSTTGFAPPG